MHAWAQVGDFVRKNGSLVMVTEVTDDSYFTSDGGSIDIVEVPIEDVLLEAEAYAEQYSGIRKQQSWDVDKDMMMSRTYLRWREQRAFEVRLVGFAEDVAFRLNAHENLLAALHAIADGGLSADRCEAIARMLIKRYDR